MVSSSVDVYKMYLICIFKGASSTYRHKNAPEGACTIWQDNLTAEQIAFFSLKWLSDQYQQTDDQISGKDAYQPLRHLQRQEFPLAHGAVAGGDEYLRQPFIQRQPRRETRGETRRSGTEKGAAESWCAPRLTVDRAGRCTARSAARRRRNGFSAR